MRLLSSEAKDWKSRVVTETEQVLRQESAQAMDKQFQVRWKQTEAKLRELCKSNSAHVQTLTSKLHETQLEHQQLYTAQEAIATWGTTSSKLSSRARTCNARVPSASRSTARDFRKQLSQQTSHKADIHELYAEMLNMRDSEVKAAMSAQMRRLETPSRTVESEPPSFPQNSASLAGELPSEFFFETVRLKQFAVHF